MLQHSKSYSHSGASKMVIEDEASKENFSPSKGKKNFSEQMKG